LLHYNIFTSFSFYNIGGFDYNYYVKYYKAQGAYGIYISHYSLPIYLTNGIFKLLQDDLVLSGLLLIFTEDVDVPARLVGSVRSVVTTALGAFTQAADLGNLLGSELDLLEVVTNARGSHRLGDDTVTADLGPGENNVGASDLSAGALGDSLGDLLNLGASDQKGDVKHVVTEGLVHTILVFDRASRREDVKRTE